jgi:hypothetical protein
MMCASARSMGNVGFKGRNGGRTPIRSLRSCERVAGDEQHYVGCRAALSPSQVTMTDVGSEAMADTLDCAESAPREMSIPSRKNG